MQNRFKRFALGTLTAVIGASLVLSGCAGTTTNPNAGQQQNKGPVTGGTYITTTIGDAKVLIPTLTADTASSTVTGYIYDGMFAWDDKLQPQPALAKSWTVEQDRIYTFKLRDDVKWHDGTPFTADDVVFTFNSIAHPKYQGVRFSGYTSFKGWAAMGTKYAAIRKELSDKKIDQATADKQLLDAYNEYLKGGAVTAPDKYTVRVELSEPFAPIFISLGMGIIPKHLLEAHLNDMQNSPLAKKPVGTGQYKFVEWVKDDRVVMTRNADWKWGVKGKAGNIDKVIIKVLPDTQANMVALETGESDSAGIQPDNYQHFKNNVKHVNVITGMQFSYTYLGYNLKNPMFADKKVRQAITHAINRQEIVDKLLVGQGEIAHGHFSPIRWDYNPNVPKFNYNVDQAKKLLDEAGWAVGADGIRAKGGQKMQFEIATNAGNKLREQSAVIIQQALKQVGMDVKVNFMEWNAFLDYVDSDKKQAYILGWSLGFDPDSYGIFHTQGGFNIMHGYANAEIDKLYEEGRKVTDLNKRKEIYGKAAAILAEDQVYTWLYFPNSIQGVNKRVQGVPGSVGPAGLAWNFEDWWLMDAKSAK